MLNCKFSLHIVFWKDAQIKANFPNIPLLFAFSVIFDTSNCKSLLRRFRGSFFFVLYFIIRSSVSHLRVFPPPPPIFTGFPRVSSSSATADPGVTISTAVRTPGRTGPTESRAFFGPPYIKFREVTPETRARERFAIATQVRVRWKAPIERARAYRSCC